MFDPKRNRSGSLLARRLHGVETMTRTVLDRPAGAEIVHLGFQALDLEPDATSAREGEQDLSAWRLGRLERDCEELQRRIRPGLEATALDPLNALEVKARFASALLAAEESLMVDARHHGREPTRPWQEHGIPKRELRILEMGRHDRQVILVHHGEPKTILRWRSCRCCHARVSCTAMRR